jgi:hypothetical protein
MFKQCAIALCGLVIVGSAGAKLPPPTPEQQAAAALAAAKTGHANKVAAYDLCMTQTRVAEGFIKQQKTKGVTVTPVPTDPCVNPGPFVAPAAAPAAPGPQAAAAAPATAAPAAKPATAPAKK